MGRVGSYRHRTTVLAISLCCLGAVQSAFAQSNDISAFKDQVFQLLNQQRAANGVSPLRRVGPLDQASQSYADTMRDATAGGPIYFSHTSPDGTTFSDRISRAGYNWYTAGENIAAGQRSPQEVVSAWMNSPGHRANILNPNFRDVGVGLAVGPGVWPNGYRDPQIFWWVTDFGNSTTDYAAAGSGAPAAVASPSAPATPAITGYYDAGGAPISSASPGTTIRIAGSNLDSGGTVRFNGISAPTPTAWTPTSITVAVPAAPSYPWQGPITVVVNGQSVNGSVFTIKGPAVVTQPTPPATGATPVTPPTTNNAEPSGSNSTPVNNPTPNSTPTPSPGTSTPGTAPSTANPTITGITDAAGNRLSSARTASMIVLHGHGFGDRSKALGVIFSGASGYSRGGSVSSWSDDTIIVTVPYVTGPARVSVQVSTPQGVIVSNPVGLTIVSSR